ncbi:hypothetical protein ATE92_1874 [Ulvibacter sp. MAR_2010_11]|uniref:hypothetical protein n=1 Tax=Ulvibacter sp. MAR_2010_11 TaxID=1250229 RepID=UPI000C2BE69A|nr:hypothetical protein [Ulvibacter sp. MAR_2010_11]PKA83708.1 hypothetical protein ATE92_1874 [Ulvibacter sp. MAR_2010_11]
MIHKICLFIAITFLLFSCKNNPDKEQNTGDSTHTAAHTDNHLKEIPSPVQGNSAMPRLFSNGADLFLSWVERKDSVATLNFSILKDEKWSTPEAVASGKDWFVNWADFPAIAESNGNILTNYLQKSANGTYTYDVKLNLYTPPSAENSDGLWKKNFLLHNDGTQSEHGFVSIRPYVDDSFLVVWLDGRETVGKDHGGGQMTLRGAIVFKDGSVQYDTLLDDSVCDCCQTSVAIGSNDEIIVAYRDRSKEELRDISIVRWQKDGGWSKPMTIGNDNWKIPGCPVNGPSIDAFENNAVVAWFTEAKGEGDVNVAFSNDNGANFGKSFRIDVGNATGRVDVAMLSEEEAAVLWMEPKGEETVIQLMKINVHGYTEPAVTIATTSPNRSTGFPQLEIVGDTAYIAWTMISEKEATIKTASIALKDF